MIITKERVEEALNLVRPAIRADGGDVELVRIRDDNVVEVKMTGACGNCPMAIYTLKAGIERVLKDVIPEIKEVVQAKK